MPRWRDCFRRARLVALDVAAWALSLARGLGKAIEGYSVAAGGPNLAPPRSATLGARPAIGAADKRSARIVAWFYRWHPEPDREDWEDCVRRFGLAQPPPHWLKFGSCPSQAIQVSLDLGRPTPGGPPGTGRARWRLRAGSADTGWVDARLGDLSLVQLTEAANRLLRLEPARGARGPG